MGHLGPLATMPEAIQKLKLALVEAVTPEEITEVVRELKRLCLPGEWGPDTQLRAMSLLFDRVLGKPSQEVNVNKQTVSVQAVKHDFTKLPTDDLKQLQAILEKTEAPTVIDVEPEADAQS